MQASILDHFIRYYR